MAMSLQKGDSTIVMRRNKQYHSYVESTATVDAYMNVLKSGLQYVGIICIREFPSLLSCGFV